MGWVGLGLCLDSMGIFGLDTQKGSRFWVLLGIVRFFAYKNFAYFSKRQKKIQQQNQLQTL